MSTALIFGASGGIGRALAQQLRAKGWTVGAVSRHPHDLAELTEFRYEADVADEFAVQRAIYSAAQELAAIDLWVYAVGDILSSPVAEMKPEAWKRILDANLTGAYLATHYSLPLLAEQAHLLYIGAYGEKLRLPGLSAYAAAKAGLEAFVTTLAKEQRKLRVTVVRPGAVDTPLWNKTPMRLPRNALTPEALAEQILHAHESGASGVLDF
ncbi:MAG: SDR family NAD(P)-dependent oxidoreductase [Caldilinea sp.]|nr:SDR family NAD(P)-dependent oxidoreductase [Caldilinea sp.]MDW8442795.1 SDR family NAD(P)-dependent oxidoreductase [Caldilineaceae bacterium]